MQISKLPLCTIRRTSCAAKLDYLKGTLHLCICRLVLCSTKRIKKGGAKVGRWHNLDKFPRLLPWPFLSAGRPFYSVASFQHVDSTLPLSHFASLRNPIRPKIKWARRKQHGVQTISSERKITVRYLVDLISLSLSLSLSLFIPPLVWAARQCLLFLMPSPNWPSNIATWWRELPYMQKTLSLSRFSSFTSSSNRLAAESNKWFAAPCEKSSGPDRDPSFQMQICAKASTSVVDVNGDAKASAGRFNLPYAAKTIENPSKEFSTFQFFHHDTVWNMQPKSGKFVKSTNSEKTCCKQVAFPLKGRGTSLGSGCHSLGKRNALKREADVSRHLDQTCSSSPDRIFPNWESGHVMRSKVQVCPEFLLGFWKESAQASKAKPQQTKWKNIK